MRSLQLHSAVTDFVEAAAGHLQAEVEAGAEVPFEVGSRSGRSRRGAAPLYCYRALTGAFIAEREPALRRLAGYGEAAKLLEGFDGLERYVARSGANASRATGKARAGIALRALLEEVFDEQTDFHVAPGRVEAALERLDQSAAAGAGQLTLLATLHGLEISAPELQLAKGLKLAHPDAIDGVPPEALPDAGAKGAAGHLLVVHSFDGQDLLAGQERGRGLLQELLRALRLFGDGRVTLGALGWVRLATGAFSPVAIGTGGRPRGMLLVTAGQEDELRAFCSLVSRRAPARGELAWALRRFELGCDRDSPREALTDHLLALRALLEPEGPASGLLAGRLAALCATPEERAELAHRVLAAIELERAIVAGASAKESAVRAAGEELASHLRALLSDVICGHLDADLAALADELLVADAESEQESEPPESEQEAEQEDRQEDGHEGQQTGGSGGEEQLALEDKPAGTGGEQGRSAASQQAGGGADEDGAAAQAGGEQPKRPLADVAR